MVGRSRGKADAVCYLAGTRAALGGTGVTFQPVVADFGARLADVLAGARPTGVFVCASHQSPWERVTAPSAWTDLLARAGFGLALPLHADIAARAERLIATHAPGAWLVNACFPDAVNPVLAGLEIPVLCGVGNVGTLAASLQAALGLPDQTRLQLLAHHAHLHPPHDAADEACAWLDGTPLPDITALLATQRATDRALLNRLTGLTAALVLSAMLTGDTADTHVPGPNGLPGGYPVRVAAGRVSLRLPADIGEAEAVGFNQRAAKRDGVRVEDGKVHLEPAVVSALPPAAPGLESFDAAELTGVCRELLALRAELRKQPHNPAQTKGL
ncbi:hypothetical protein [Actinophytocola sp.]|uniref:hypothetical protein n=1 Tax=Actinophytocola sp. TaxID=1872138 RepID=UPI0025BBA8BD|nr:hypothetical protein [Actinophytocola sp.]